jgi:hypothetical protein
MTVVGIERVGKKDWLDAWGHYWAWDKAARVWRRDRDRDRRCGRPHYEQWLGLDR